METTSEFRVKFSDIRVKSKGRGSTNPYVNRREPCNHPGCEEIGEHPAPRKDGKGQFWFCQEHAAQYNQKYNFFDQSKNTDTEKGIGQEGVSRDRRFGVGGFTSSLHTRQASTERQSRAEREAAIRAKMPKRSIQQIRALNELGLESDATPEAVRARYADYVRKFHPDSNDGDRSSEDKLARIIRAGKVLKSAGFM